MKRILLLLAIAWFGALVPRTQAAELTVDLFYDELAPYGDWVDAGEYGYAWHPRDVSPDWRPYSDGRWAYTDAGWTWVSEEPYSWAVYHYGRWTNLNDVGWSWVPGREWGPAWVSFRRSDRYVGWAPLPPEASFGREVTTISSWSDSYYDVGPTQYTFVETRNFGAPRLRQYIAPQRDNITIINETTNITNIRVENNSVYNGGPDYTVISRESAQPIQRLRLDRRTDVTVSDRNAFRSSVQGDSLRVAAPMFQAFSGNAAPAKVSRRLDRVEVNHGWRDAGDAAATQQLRTKMQAEAKVPAGLPPKPTFQRAGATAAGGANAPAGAQPGRTPQVAVDPVATPSSKPATKPNSRTEPTAATDPNSTPGATSTDRNGTPPPNAKTAKGKKGQRGNATPAPTAAAEPTTAPNAVAPEKSTEAQPGDAPAKGKKGQRTAPATPAARNDVPVATPPGQKKVAPRDESAPAVTPSRPTRPESANEPAERPANPPKTRPSETANPANGPTERAPEARPQRPEPKAPPVEKAPQAVERAREGVDPRQKERAPEGADNRPKEHAPEAPKAHQPVAEPQSAAPRGPAPANKGQKKDEKKDEKKPEGAPQ